MSLNSGVAGLSCFCVAIWEVIGLTAWPPARLTVVLSLLAAAPVFSILSACCTSCLKHFRKRDWISSFFSGYSCAYEKFELPYGGPGTWLDRFAAPIKLIPLPPHLKGLLWKAFYC